MGSEWGLRYFLMLFVYLAILAAAAYLLTRFVKLRRRGFKGKGKPGFKDLLGLSELGQSEKYVKVLERTALGRDSMLVTFEFQGKLYLVSAATGDVKLLDSVELPGLNEDPPAALRGNDES